MPKGTRSASWRRTATALGALLACAGVVGIAAWVGCSIYDPSLLLPAADAGPDVVTQDETGAPDAAPDVPNACPELFPPDKPAADDPSDAGDQTFVVALHTLDLGIEEAGAPPPAEGYDLDKVYTCCDGGPESCKAAQTGATHCDEALGRDNSGEQLLSSLAALPNSPFNTASVNQRLEQGLYSILVQISRYNGQPNDTQVTAALYASLGIDSAGDAAPPPASWDGGDVWTLDQNFVLSDAGPVLPTHFDSNAYVAGGKLVMHVNFPISLGTSATGSLSISLTSGIITGDLVPEGSNWRLANGVIAGRWNAGQLLDALQYLGLSLGGSTTPLCRGTTTYEFVKSLICQYADIMTDPTLDKTGATCDALSIGFNFTADPALMGSVVTSPVKPTPCEAGADAAPDDCAQ